MRTLRFWAALVAVIYLGAAQVLAGAHARSLEALAPGHNPGCVLCVVGDRDAAPPAEPAAPQPLPCNGSDMALAPAGTVATLAIAAAQPRGPPSR